MGQNLATMYHPSCGGCLLHAGKSVGRLVSISATTLTAAWLSRRVCGSSNIPHCNQVAVRAAAWIDLMKTVLHLQPEGLLGTCFL
jgi:hypothetical protein